VFISKNVRDVLFLASHGALSSLALRVLPLPCWCNAEVNASLLDVVQQLTLEAMQLSHSLGNFGRLARL